MLTLMNKIESRKTHKCALFIEESTTTRVRGKLENMGVWHSGNCGGL